NNWVAIWVATFAKSGVAVGLVTSGPGKFLSFSTSLDAGCGFAPGKRERCPSCIPATTCLTWIKCADLQKRYPAKLGGVLPWRCIPRLRKSAVSVGRRAWRSFAQSLPRTDHNMRMTKQQFDEAVDLL